MKVNTLFNNSDEITLESYLKLHGIDDVDEFIKPQGKYLDSGLSYSNMEQAITTLHNLPKDAKCCIVQDSDVDGIMSATLAYLFLEHLGIKNIDTKFHTKKSHGLSTEIMNGLFSESCCHYDFVWLPDAGTNDVDGCKAITNNGQAIVLITDHHMSTTNNSYATIVNNQLSPNVTNKSLCGTGVTYKVIQTYCQTYGDNWHRDYIDLVAVANIADVMEMNNYENRTFNYYGLKNIYNPFLLALKKEFVKEYEVTPKDISWGIAPKLNALCRSNNQELKDRVFKALVGLETDYDSVISELKSCHNKQTRDVNDIYDKLIAVDTAYIGDVIMQNIDNTPYTGLVANKLMDYYKRPIILVHKNKNDMWIGSARSPVPFKSILNNSGVMDICSGHEQAFGVGWQDNNTRALIHYLNNTKLDFTPQIDVTYAVDNVMQIPHTLYDFADRHRDLWGTGIPTPTVYLENIQIKSSDIKELGRNTIKFRLGLTDVLKFNCSKALKEKLHVGNTVPTFITLNIVGEPSLNVWNNRVTPQIIINEVEVV